MGGKQTKSTNNCGRNLGIFSNGYKSLQQCYMYTLHNMVCIPTYFLNLKIRLSGDFFPYWTIILTGLQHFPIHYPPRAVFDLYRGIYRAGYIYF